MTDGKNKRITHRLYSYNHGQGNMNEPTTEKLEANFTSLERAIHYMKNSGICFEGLDLKPTEPAVDKRLYEMTRARGLGTLHFILKENHQDDPVIPLDPKIIYYKNTFKDNEWN